MDKVRTLTYDPYKEISNDALDFTLKGSHKFCMTKQEGRELARIEDCMDAAILGIKEYIKKAKKDWLLQSLTAISIKITKGQAGKEQ